MTSDTAHAYSRSYSPLTDNSLTTDTALLTYLQASRISRAVNIFSGVPRESGWTDGNYAMGVGMLGTYSKNESPLLEKYRRAFFPDDNR